LELGDYDYCGNTAVVNSIPRYYRQLCPYYLGITADAAVIPLCLSPYSSLTRIRTDLHSPTA